MPIALITLIIALDLMAWLIVAAGKLADDAVQHIAPNTAPLED